VSTGDAPFPPRAPLIRVEGGIRARNRRGRIGRTWWSRRFLEVLESLQLGGRLARGRTYARQGQVLSLQVRPGEVSATVQGTSPRPYRVQIALAPFPDQVWTVVEGALAEQAIYSARLLAGEMPPDIEDVCTTAGAPLFPQHPGDLWMSCSCPDPATPCKHIAAACYLLAESFDDDPFRILHWRGRERGPLLARLRELRQASANRDSAGAGAGADAGAEPDADAGTDATVSADVTGAAAAVAGVTSHPLAADLERFWLPPVPLPARPVTMAAVPDLLLRALPPPGAALGGSDLASYLQDAYRRFAGTAAGAHPEGDDSHGSVRS
jgi:uncharacterized Zn finger protein